MEDFETERTSVLEALKNLLILDELQNPPSNRFETERTSVLEALKNFQFLTTIERHQNWRFIQSSLWKDLKVLLRGEYLNLSIGRKLLSTMKELRAF